MSINIKKTEHVKKVDKPWGYERWIADGSPNFKYALKELFFKSDFKSSIQFHEFKEETTYVQKGTGILYYSSNPINLEKYKNGEYNDDEINHILEHLEEEELSPGMVYHIKPGIIHRVKAITDLTLIESSTIELEDVIRINDEWGRHDGKIEKEHRGFFLTSDFYLSQNERIKFSKKHARGKVLFCSYGVNSEYFCSKLLLDSGCKEVWYYGGNLDCDVSIRKLNQNNGIDYEFGPEIDQIPEKSFDTILSFEVIQFQENPKSIIEKYHKLLKDNGVLIISTANKNTRSVFLEYNTSPFGFSKDKLLEIIRSFFTKTEIFSQRNISKLEQKQQNFGILDNMLSKLRSGSKKILLNVDKKQNFYKLHLQKTIIQLRQKKRSFSKKLLNVDYVPMPFDESQNPTTFLLICKK